MISHPECQIGIPQDDTSEPCSQRATADLGFAPTKLTPLEAGGRCQRRKAKDNAITNLQVLVLDVDCKNGVYPKESDIHE